MTAFLINLKNKIEDFCLSILHLEMSSGSMLEYDYPIPFSYKFKSKYRAKLAGLSDIDLQEEFLHLLGSSSKYQPWQLDICLQEAAKRNMGKQCWDIANETFREAFRLGSYCFRGKGHR